ncbi:Signal transduction histidine kinase [Pseudobutyrivibrio xylanivorans]|uniref:Stage 0 sporulation protein A homolog n=2 Tax=Pseudobutyrivibrio xylanivorans TaxID=185007 RepID=A0A1G5RUR3_PSEXY|nr:Signal transduction histidine kinase [Pseudobutyrivibrio xylanivorans]
MGVLLNMGYKKRAKTLLILMFVIMVSFAGKPNVFAAENTKEENLEQKYGGGYAASGQLDGFGYTTKLFDSTNGLPTSDANYILCADTGYIWLGGYSGILRYDGSVFERMNSTGGLTSGRSLYQDKKGRLWVGTNDNGVVCLDHRARTQITDKDGLPSRCVRAITEDNKGNIFVGTNAGVAYIDSDFNVSHIKESRVNNGRTMRLTTDNDGGVYGYCDNGYVYYIEDCKLVKLLRGTDLGIENITTAIADPNESGMIYYGTNSGNVYYGKYGEGAESLKKIESGTELKGAYWLTYDCGRVWASSHDTIGYIGEDWKFKALEDLPMTSDIEMITSDYQGNLWVASSTKGVMKIVSSSFYDITLDTEVRDHQVFATYIYDNKLYIGTESGLFVLDKRGNSLNSALKDYIGEARIRHITSDSKNNLWISVYSTGKGLVCQKPNGEIINFTFEDGLASNQVRCVMEASDGTIIVGGNEGLSYIKDYKIVEQKDESYYLKNSVILSLTEIDGDIYVGTDGDGVFILTDRGIRTLTLDNGLTSDIVMRIKWDEFRKVTWLITSNSVQYIKDDVVVNVTTFPYNNCYDLYFDHEDDEIWILASNGIYCVDGSDMVDDNVVYYKHYTLLNGLPSIPTANGYSGIDADDGEIFVSCRRGVCKFNIDKFVEDYVDIRFDIKNVISDGVEIFPDDDGVFVIPAGATRVSFIPAILDYTESAPKISMSLDGVKDKGITVQLDELKPLEYTGLKYGSYTLRIQVLNHSGNEVIQEKTFEIIKKPRFFEMLLVQIIVIFLFAVVGGLLVWRILSKTIIHKQYVQLQEAKEQAFRANAVKDRFLANISDILRKPLITIMGADEMILRRDPSISSNEYFFSVINDALDIKKASEDLLELIDSMLKISKVETGKMALEEEEYGTVFAMRATVSTIRKLCVDKGLNFEVEVDEKMPEKLYGDVEKISYIFRILLSNAVKYTANGGVILRATVLSTDEDICDLEISVKDTGIGVKDEYKEFVFNSFHALGTVPEGIPYDFGLGLNLSVMFAEMMGGSISCNSEYGQGAEFIFRFKQKIIDATNVGIFREKDSEVAHGLYIPSFIAPDAEVLIVDGTPSSLAILKGLLKDTKMFIATASTGEECIERIKFGEFHVVLLDYLVADIDAEDLITRIHEIKPGLPIYALSTVSTENEDFYKAKGFAGLLLKPVDSAAMEKIIVSHIPGNIYIRLSDTDGDTDDVSLPEDMEWLYDIEEINVPEGIRESGGAGKYIASLRVFIDALDAYANGIEDAYRNLDIKLYTIKIHSLRNSFVVVGATALETMAEALEAAGNRNDIEYISENTENFLSSCRRLYGKLAKIHPFREG